MTDFFRWRGCESKRYYRTKQIADLYALKAMSKYQRFLSTYKCQYCNGWHICREERRSG